MLRAVLQAGRLIADPKNSEDVIAYIIRLFKLDRNLAEQFYRRLVASLSLTGMVEMDRIRLAIESAVERGVIDKPVDPVMVVDFSISRKLDQKVNTHLICAIDRRRFYPNSALTQWSSRALRRRRRYRTPDKVERVLLASHRTGARIPAERRGKWRRRQGVRVWNQRMR